MDIQKTLIGCDNDGFIEKFFSKEEINCVIGIKTKDRAHPLKQLINCTSGGKDSYVKVNTDLAYKQLRKDDNHMNWLKSQKARFLEKDDFSASSGALGELRCFGELLTAGFSVTPIRVCAEDNTPDFKIRNNDNETDEVWIEVHSKQMCKEEAAELERFFSADPELRPIIGNDITASIRMTDVVPMGRPRPDKPENTTANVISKIAQIKGGEEPQLSTDQPSVLWLDFQDQTWHLTMNEYQVNPIVSYKEELTAGYLWYAFYGYDGAPIFESHSTEERSREDIVLMRHPGRFRQKTKVDAVIISLPTATIALENPFSQKPVPSWFWRKAILFTHFRLQFSKLNWPCKNLEQIIKSEQDIIEAWKSIPLYRWSSS